MKGGTSRSRTGQTIAFVLIILIFAFYAFMYIAGRRNAEKSETAPELPVAAAETEPEDIQTPEPETPAGAARTESEASSESESEREIEEENRPAGHGDNKPDAISVTRLGGEISDTLDGIAAKYDCAAASLAVFDGEGEFYTYQYGYADKENGRAVGIETKFRVASLSKLITAMCAMALVDEGKIDLDRDISEYAGYTIRNPAYPDKAITCRMLLQHTSSLFDSEDFSRSRSGNSSESTKTLLDTGTSYKKREPGSKHEYSNFGFAVLGSICEIVSGRQLDTLARDSLFRPLGIDAAYTPGSLQDTGSVAVIYNQSHNISRSVKSQLDIGASDELGHDHHLAQGNLTISALDYAKLLAVLTNGGVLGGVRILSEASSAEIQAADFSTGVYEQGLAVRFQSGAFLGEDVYWHTGSAYGELTQFIYDDTLNFGVVVLTTGSDSGREDNGMVKVCGEMTGAVWKHAGLRSDTQNESTAAAAQNSLRGMTVCIDPGHQSKGDSGHEAIAPGAEETKPKVASGTSGVSTKTPEYVLTLEIGLALRDRLEDMGARVVMTRTEHDVNISNSERAALANENGSDMVIRIHADGSGNPEVRGYSILVPGSVYTPGITAESERMARLLDKALKSRVEIPSRGLITRDDLTGFNWLTVPGILIEAGYMTNGEDDRIMQTEEFQTALIDAVAEALLQYISGAGRQ